MKNAHWTGNNHAEIHSLILDVGLTGQATLMEIYCLSHVTESSNDLPSFYYNHVSLEGSLELPVWPVASVALHRGRCSR